MKKLFILLLGHSMSTEPKWPLQIFMKFSPFDLIIEVWKTWKFQLAPTISEIMGP